MLKPTLKDRRDQSGFTIIEVLIVLAIAGLILLIVFLAVPALQRNARNTAIKNDVQSVLGGFSDYAGANDGAYPTGVAGTGSVDFTGATGTNKTTTKIQGSTAVSVVTTAPTTPITSGTIQLVLKNTCSTATGGTGQASSRASAAYYNIETSGGNLLKCQDS